MKLNNKNLRWLILGAAVAGMGLGMPSCPGQQAMQEQVDKVQKENVTMNRSIVQMRESVTAVSGDMAQTKTLLAAMADSIKGSEAKLQELTLKVTSLEAKMAEGATKGKQTKLPSKKKGR